MLGYAALLMNMKKPCKNALSGLGMNIVSVHHGKQHRDIIEQADVIAIGGGNTFCLLKQLYEHNLIDIIREKVNNGTPYFWLECWGQCSWRIYYDN